MAVTLNWIRDFLLTLPDVTEGTSWDAAVSYTHLDVYKRQH